MDAGQRQAKAGHGNHEQLINSSINPRNNHTNQVLNCPRCNSLNTKFCYYNNYSLLQPRHFCKNCRRYWTSGGVLRNVPVGGGCRKNKRSSSSTSSSSTPSKQRLGADNSASCSISTVITAPTAQLSTVHRRQNDLSSVSNVLQLQPSAALPESTTTSTTLPTSLYYALHRNNNISPIEYGDEPSFPFTSRPLTQPSTLRLTDRICQISTNPSLNPLANPSLRPLAAHSSLLNLQSRSSTAANHHLASLPPFTLASLRSHLSNFGSFSLRNELMGLDFNAANYPKQPSLHPNLLDPTAISEDLKHNPHLNSNPHLPSATTVVTSTTPSTGTAVISNDVLLNSFSLALDSFNSNNRDDGQWKSHHQKQIKLPNQSNSTNDQQEGQLRGQLQVLLPFENQAMGGLMQQHSQQSAKPGLMPDNFKVKGELEPPVENWPGQEGFLEPSAADANYWNNTNSPWPDLSAYGPSTATHLL